MENRDMFYKAVVQLPHQTEPLSPQVAFERLLGYSKQLKQINFEMSFVQRPSSM